ncbi:MAG: hypothetical protein ABJN36_10175 [Cyclobacteriaceae bacterium]
MKRISATIVTLFIVSAAFSQTTYKEAEKMIKKDKAVKEARKEAKKWEKQDYTNLPGNLPLANQFERSLVMQVMLNDDGEQRYLTATGSAISGSEGVAQANAMDNTRVQLAGVIQSEVSALVTNNKGNTGYTADEMQTVDEFLSSSKTLIQNKIGRIKPVIEMMRRVDDKFEYRFTVMYDTEEAKRIAKEILQEGLQDKVGKNEDELNKLLGL